METRHVQPIKKEDIEEKLSFARNRSEDLKNLNNGDISGADASLRQQLLQEFFFHLVGVLELLAHLINESRRLGIPEEEVTISKVKKLLADDDSLKTILNKVYQRTTNKPVPIDAYSEDGYFFRLWNYRHQVTHRRRNPFFILVNLQDPNRMRTACLMIDPRDKSRGPANKPALIELE
jgi:hypothetical protein